MVTRLAQRSGMEPRRWTAPQLGGGRRRSEATDSLTQALAKTPLNLRRIMAAAVAAERASQEGRQRKAVELLDAKVILCGAVCERKPASFRHAIINGTRLRDLANQSMMKATSSNRFQCVRRMS